MSTEPAIIDEHVAMLRTALQKADRGALRESDLAARTKLAQPAVHAALELMREAGEIVACTVIIGGAEQLEVRLAEGAVQGRNCSLGPLSRSSAAWRTEREAAEQKGLLRIPGSHTSRFPAFPLANMAAIGPRNTTTGRAETGAPSTTPASSTSSTQEIRSMTAQNTKAETHKALTSAGPLTVAELCEKTGLTSKQVSNALSNLKKNSKAVRQGKHWAAATGSTTKAAPAKPKKKAAQDPNMKTLRAVKRALEERHVSTATAELGRLNDNALAGPVNILKLQGGDVLVLRGNVVKAQLSPAEVEALKQAA